MAGGGGSVPAGGVFAAPEGQSQSDQAYQLIKRDILTCAIEPSSRMTEAEFGERYGLGRASIRTALNRLYQEALVDVLPRYGYIIAPHSVSDARDLFQLQAILEPAAGRLAAGRVDARRLLALDERCRKTSSISNSDDAAAFLHANTNFHEAVASASGNALIARFVRILFERLERFLYCSGFFEDVVREVSHSHGEVVELLIAGHADEVERAVSTQLQHNQHIILEALARRGYLRDSLVSR